MKHFLIGFRRGFIKGLFNPHPIASWVTLIAAACAVIYLLEQSK